MKKVKLSEHAKSIIISVGISIIAMCALMAALFSANFLLGALVASYDPALCWYMSATAIALVGVYNFVIVHRLEYKLLKIGRLSIAGIYVVLAILLAIFGSKEYAFTVVASIFFALRIALSVLDIISNHRKRDIVRNFFVVLIFWKCLMKARSG